jgi:glycosyltransferase involved in cell wall biosynthesis
MRLFVERLKPCPVKAAFMQPVLVPDLDSPKMTTLQTETLRSENHARREANAFLFISSGWRGVMLWPGGIAEYINSLARGLMSLGDSVRMLGVVRPEENMPTDFLRRYEPWATPFQLVKDDRPANLLSRKCISLLEIFRCLSPPCRYLLEKTSLFRASTGAIARFEQLLEREGPTTVVFGNFDMWLYPFALSLLERGRQYGIIGHGCEVARPQGNKINDLVLRQTLLKGASWIAANSCHTKSLLETWRIPPARIRILHPPISEEAMRESATLEPGSTKDDALSLVTICRLVRGKGVDIVLRALKDLAARGIPFQYIIGGDGPERSSLEVLADALGLRDKVHFKGSVVGEEKWRVLRDADIFVMPSRFDAGIHPWQESFGIAFLEAAAFGVPAVGSKSGGIPDAVVDGETGILVAEESHGDLTDALTFLYQEPEIRKRMGMAARERARREFSPTVIASRFKEEVSKLAR